jgi:hypothetical protein
MQKNVCTRLLGTHFVDGARHWVQQGSPPRGHAVVVFLERSAAVSAGR